MDGEAEGNWISPRLSLFDIFVKLFNLCLSPKQAFEHINECLAKYKEMFKADHRLSDAHWLSIRKSNRDGKVGELISFSVGSIIRVGDILDEHRFDITTSLKIVEDHINDITAHVENLAFVCQNEMLQDALMLFEYHQNGKLLRKVFDMGIKELESKNSIKEASQNKICGWVVHQYETDMEANGF